TLRATLIGRLMRLMQPTAPAACGGPQKIIASWVTSPSSSGRPPTPTLGLVASSSTWLTPRSTASSALPPAARTVHASWLAGRPKSQVLITAGSPAAGRLLAARRPAHAASAVAAAPTSTDRRVDMAALYRGDRLARA